MNFTQNLCSIPTGHGFKLAPVVGKLLAELALEKNLSYDLFPFRIDRFIGLKSSL